MRRVLYLTYSSDLAALARDYFEKFCSRQCEFSVLTYDAFLRRLADSDAPPASLSELRSRFRADVMPFGRALGPWADHVPALFDEFHAHLVGAALPVAIGRYSASSAPRTSDKDYRTRRIRFLGEPATLAALDVASRLERNHPSLAARYFPELALAWKAASALTSKDLVTVSRGFLDIDCVCVDECQDLTPLEALAAIELTSLLAHRGLGRTPLFCAGDEAQTVRPTDFEWGWMNDLLHSRLTTPTEFKLSANLRSPRSIAGLVNHVWDLYGHIDKRDRPSGTGYADIEDDATDQILYCAASPGPDFDQCLQTLAAREGLALVSYDESLINSLPAPIRPAILTAREVKGLDFHTICLLNAGQHLEKIVRSSRENTLSVDIESLRRRLAIDELRVGISRPSERLIWLDASPSPDVVRETISFLGDRGQRFIAPTVPAALLTALAEEQLDLEERIQRSMHDARQFLSVRPELAWSRAQQAVALLGDPANSNSVSDHDLIKAAHDTLAEICFCLGFRGVQLAPELGRPDLFAVAASATPNLDLKRTLSDLGRVLRAPDRHARVPALGSLAQSMVHSSTEIGAWLLNEIAQKIPGWLDDLESALSPGNATLLARILPPFYIALRLPDAPARTDKFLNRCIRLLIREKQHADALALLTALPDRKPDLEADCHRAMGNHAEAAALFQSIGDLKEALDCYRAAPDFDAAAALIGRIPDHTAAESYQWLLQLRALLEKRPASFSKAMLASEKKVLEQMLEQGLGVRKRPPAPRKTATKRASTKKTAAKKASQPVPPWLKPGSHY